MILLICLLLGAIAGVTAGLFGVGGGVIIVPALVFLFEWQQYSPAVLTHLAIGTSLATIVFTSLSSIRAHHLLGNVRWPLVLVMTPGIVVGSVLGMQLASNMAGQSLQLAFGVFIVLIALQMGFGLRPTPGRQLPASPVLISVGAVIGGVSALFGIGGGSMTVPFMLWCNVRMQQAVAIAAACGLPIAIAGAASAVFAGWQHAGLPQYSLGFIYLPGFLGIVLVSGFAAKWGAKLAHRLPALRLQQGFAVFLFIVGLQFIVRNL